MTTTERLAWRIQELRKEVAARRRITAVDPVADTIDYIASELEEDMRATVEMNVAQFSAMHSVAPQTVRRWCRENRIASMQVGGDYRIMSDQVPPAGRRVTRRA